MAKNFQYSSHEVKKLVVFSLFSYYNFEETVTNFEKDILRKESLA